MACTGKIHSISVHSDWFVCCALWVFFGYREYLVLIFFFRRNLSSNLLVVLWDIFCISILTYGSLSLCAPFLCRHAVKVDQNLLGTQVKVMMGQTFMSVDALDKPSGLHKDHKRKRVTDGRGGLIACHTRTDLPCAPYLDARRYFFC